MVRFSRVTNLNSQLLPDGYHCLRSMRPTNYLFVNKSERSGSLSHSEKSERIKIHSHVQLAKLESRKNEDDKEVLSPLAVCAILRRIEHNSRHQGQGCITCQA